MNSVHLSGEIRIFTTAERLRQIANELEEKARTATPGKDLSVCAFKYHGTVVVFVHDQSAGK
jgi:hypothetical protein